MYPLHALVAAIASSGVAASPIIPILAPRPYSQGSACVHTVKDQCLNGVKHRDSILSQAGCNITAELQCEAHPDLPKYAPSVDLLKRALTWSPPASCKAEWDECTSEVNIPFFNRPVCAQYLPVLCKDKLKGHDEEARVDHALTVLYNEFSETLAFFYDHVPASKAVNFDRCIAATPAHANVSARNTTSTTSTTTNGTHSVYGTASTASTGPDAQVFFKCLAQAKTPTPTPISRFQDFYGPSIGPLGRPWPPPWPKPRPTPPVTETSNNASTARDNY